MRLAYLFLCGLLLSSGCASPSVTSTASQRLPTRAPTPTPTVTPFAISAWTYYEEGLTRQRVGDAEGALQSLTWAIQRAPDFAPAYVARGSVYLAQEELDLALVEADAALEIAPSGAAHALRGETLRLLDRPRAALEAFDQALELDTTSSTETFRSRWLAVRTIHDTVRLSSLSREYVNAHPGDLWGHYYQGWAFIELGTPGVAINTLVKGIESTPDPPALLWFALGQAYAMDRHWQEAVTALEATRALVQAGDTSLALHSDQPIVDLFSALGQAYLGVGRCADAETALEYAISIGAPASKNAAALEEARICQTPTPTITPYPTTTPSVRRRGVDAALTCAILYQHTQSIQGDRYNGKSRPA
jgi:tetratricopeptide (TPR) repeat protein